MSNGKKKILNLIDSTNISTMGKCLQ